MNGVSIWIEQCLNCGDTRDTRITGPDARYNPIGSGRYQKCPTCQQNAPHVVIRTEYREGPVANTIKPSAPEPAYVATETFGEVIRAIDREHLQAARETPPNKDYMAALRALAENAEMILKWYRIAQAKK